jgi:hypothetical protein
MTVNWPFDQGRNVATITTRAVILEGAPVLLVVHYSDDHSWAFLSGGTFDSADALVVGMGEIIDTDGSLLAVADLPPGWVAERSSVNGNWVRSQNNEA